ncbi:MAG TPA: hypothetical protein VKU41_15505, partial [Polyangiaceae bacterium]|nr:hypothetical protein [Polyangiaceae bacterium]
MLVTASGVNQTSRGRRLSGPSRPNPHALDFSSATLASAPAPCRTGRESQQARVTTQDVGGRAFCYSNADLRKGEEAEEIFQFIDFWKRTHGTLPRHLVFDSKLTT